jgi:hypothetical protein
MINLLGKKIEFRREKERFFNILEKYFDMNKKQCREALDMYKKFIERTDRVAQYLKIAEVIMKIIFRFNREESVSFMNSFSVGHCGER